MDAKVLIVVASVLVTGCHNPSPAALHRAEKHRQDSIALLEQQRTLAYYQGQLETLLPQADSLLPLFKYERNERYQDYGYYVTTARSGALRMLVRDDGRQPVTVYMNGKRVENPALNLPQKGQDDEKAYLRAEELQTLMQDIGELEKRIDRTSLEVEKYQLRLKKYEMTQRHE